MHSFSFVRGTISLAFLDHTFHYMLVALYLSQKVVDLSFHFRHFGHVVQVMLRLFIVLFFELIDLLIGSLELL